MTDRATVYDLSCLVTSLAHTLLTLSPFCLSSFFLQVIATCAEQCGSDLPCDKLKSIVYTAKCTSEALTCNCEA